jgi:hypothetical protein
MNNIEAGYMEFKPTLAMRVRRWLGFRHHLGEEPKGVENMPGWFVTETGFHFTLADRLRLLVGGRLKVRITGYADAKVDTVKNRMDWQIFAPGEEWRH